MDRDEFLFLKMEYQSLREEIKGGKDRIFKLAGLAIIGTPASYFIANAFNMTLLMLLLPGFICIILLLYLSESHGLMRCGLYIKTKIEDKIGVEGWENWLELSEKGTRDRRLVDKLVNLVFYGLFFIYYFAAVLEARKVAVLSYGDEVAMYLTAIYIAIFILFVAVVIYCWGSCTSTGKRDKAEISYQINPIIKMHAKKQK